MKSGIGEIFAGSFGKFKKYLRATFSELSEYDAEDIIQQTALSMLGRDSDEEVEYMAAYIYSALRNAAKNTFRKRGKEILSDEIYEEGGFSTEDMAMQNELRNKIEDALEMLDDKSRFVFVETELGGKSYKELSEITGEPIGTLLSRKSRAAKKLAAILNEYENKQEDYYG